MTRSRANPDGTPGELAATYYGQRASLGLVITEGTQPSEDGQGYLNTPGIYTPEHVEGWRKVADAVHAGGGAMFIQLMHVGRMSHPDNTPHHRQAVAPSAISAGKEIPTATGMQKTPVPARAERRGHPGHHRRVPSRRGFRDRCRCRRGGDPWRERVSAAPIPVPERQPPHRCLWRVGGEPVAVRHRGGPGRRGGDRCGPDRYPDLAVIPAGRHRRGRRRSVRTQYLHLVGELAPSTSRTCTSTTSGTTNCCGPSATCGPPQSWWCDTGAAASRSPTTSTPGWRTSPRSAVSRWPTPTSSIAAHRGPAERTGPGHHLQRRRGRIHRLPGTRSRLERASERRPPASPTIRKKQNMPSRNNARSHHRSKRRHRHPLRPRSTRPRR